MTFPAVPLAPGTRRIVCLLRSPTGTVRSEALTVRSWTVPTVTLRYPANIPGMPGHNWASAIAEQYKPGARQP